MAECILISSDEECESLASSSPPTKQAKKLQSRGKIQRQSQFGYGDEDIDDYSDALASLVSALDQVQQRPDPAYDYDTDLQLVLRISEADQIHSESPSQSSHTLSSQPKQKYVPRKSLQLPTVNRSLGCGDLASEIRSSESEVTRSCRCSPSSSNSPCHACRLNYSESIGVSPTRYESEVNDCYVLEKSNRNAELDKTTKNDKADQLAQLTDIICCSDSDNTKSNSHETLHESDTQDSVRCSDTMPSPSSSPESDILYDILDENGNSQPLLTKPCCNLLHHMCNVEAKVKKHEKMGNERSHRDQRLSHSSSKNSSDFHLSKVNIRHDHRARESFIKKPEKMGNERSHRDQRLSHSSSKNSSVSDLSKENIRREHRARESNSSCESRSSKENIKDHINHRRDRSYHGSSLSQRHYKHNEKHRHQTSNTHMHRESRHRSSDSLHTRSESHHRSSDSLHTRSESRHRSSDSLHTRSESRHRSSDSLHTQSESRHMETETCRTHNDSCHKDSVSPHRNSDSGHKNSESLPKHKDSCHKSLHKHSASPHKHGDSNDKLSDSPNNHSNSRHKHSDSCHKRIDSYIKPKGSIDKHSDPHKHIKTKHKHSETLQRNCHAQSRESSHKNLNRELPGHNYPVGIEKSQLDTVHCQKVSSQYRDDRTSITIDSRNSQHGNKQMRSHQNCFSDLVHSSNQHKNKDKVETPSPCHSQFHNKQTRSLSGAPQAVPITDLNNQSDDSANNEDDNAATETESIDSPEPLLVARRCHSLQEHSRPFLAPSKISAKRSYSLDEGDRSLVTPTPTKRSHSVDMLKSPVTLSSVDKRSFSTESNKLLLVTPKRQKSDYDTSEMSPTKKRCLKSFLKRLKREGPDARRQLQIGRQGVKQLIQQAKVMVQPLSQSYLHQLPEPVLFKFIKKSLKTDRTLELGNRMPMKHEERHFTDALNSDCDKDVSEKSFKQEACCTVSEKSGSERVSQVKRLKFKKWSCKEEDDEVKVIGELPDLAEFTSVKTDNDRLQEELQETDTEECQADVSRELSETETRRPLFLCDDEVQEVGRQIRRYPQDHSWLSLPAGDHAPLSLLSVDQGPPHLPLDMQGDVTPPPEDPKEPSNLPSHEQGDVKPPLGHPKAPSYVPSHEHLLSHERGVVKPPLGDPKAPSSLPSHKLGSVEPTLGDPKEPYNLHAKKQGDVTPPMKDVKEPLNLPSAEQGVVKPRLDDQGAHHAPYQVHRNLTHGCQGPDKQSLSHPQVSQAPRDRGPPTHRTTRILPFPITAVNMVNAAQDMVSEDPSYCHLVMELITAYMNSSREPTPEIIQYLMDILSSSESTSDSIEIYNMLNGILTLYPPSDVCFSWNELSAAIDKVLDNSSTFHCRFNHTLLFSYMVDCVEAEITQRKLSSKRDTSKTLANKWLNADNNLGRLKFIIQSIQKALELSSSELEDDPLNEVPSVALLLARLLQLGLVVSRRPHETASMVTAHLALVYRHLPSLEMKTQLLDALTWPVLHLSLVKSLLEDTYSATPVQITCLSLPMIFKFYIDECVLPDSKRIVIDTSPNASLCHQVEELSMLMYKLVHTYITYQKGGYEKPLNQRVLSNVRDDPLCQVDRTALSNMAEKIARLESRLTPLNGALSSTAKLFMVQLQCLAAV